MNLGPSKNDVNILLHLRGHICGLQVQFVFRNPNLLKKVLKKRPFFFLRLEAEFFFEPMLSRKTFATNSLVQNFL